MCLARTLILELLLEVCVVSSTWQSQHETRHSVTHSLIHSMERRPYHWPLIAAVENKSKCPAIQLIRSPVDSFLFPSPNEKAQWICEHLESKGVK